MAKDGQARVLSHDDFNQLLATIEQHRHPEKNALIMQISFKLGLRVQEISLLRTKYPPSKKVDFVTPYKGG